jgi:hypothetical protein
VLALRFTIGLSIAALAACASTPQQRYADDIAAAKKAGAPLLVYYVYVSHTARYEPQTHVDFFNIAAQPIASVDFQMEPYQMGGPVKDSDGKPLFNTVTAQGPYVQESSQEVLFKDPIWTAKTFIDCARITSMNIHFQDNSVVTLTGGKLSDSIVWGLGCVPMEVHSKGMPFGPVRTTGGSNHY